MPDKSEKSEEAEVCPELDNTDQSASDGSYLLQLSEQTTSEDTGALVDQILENRGRNLIIEAGKVKRFDTPCIEVLLATSRLWLTDGFSIEISNVSDSFQSCLEVLGITKTKLEVGEKS